MKNYTKFSALVLALGLGLASGVASANVNDTTSLDANAYAGAFYGQGASFTDMYSFTVGSLADYNNYLVAGITGSPVEAALSYDTARMTVTGFSLVNSSHVSVGTLTGTAGTYNLTSGKLAAGTYTIDIIGNTVSKMSGSTGYSLSVSAVPEPSEWALMASGLGLLGFIATRRTKEKLEA